MKITRRQESRTSTTSMPPPLLAADYAAFSQRRSRQVLAFGWRSGFGPAAPGCRGGGACECRRNIRRLEERGMSRRQRFERIRKCDTETAWSSRGTRPIHLRFARQGPRRTIESGRGDRMILRVSTVGASARDATWAPKLARVTRQMAAGCGLSLAPSRRRCK